MDENTGISSATAEAALEKLLPDISAIDDNAVVTCHVAGAVAVEAARQLATALKGDRSAMTATFTAAPLNMMSEVEDRALALFAAEKRLEALDPKPVNDLPALYEEGGPLKDRAVKVLDLLAGDNAEVARILDLVRPGTGYLDRAEDFAALHPLLIAKKNEIVATGFMTELDIDRVGTLAPLLLDTRGGSSETIKAARKLRNRAYTHFLIAYRQIHRHATFIHDGAPEKLAAYPNIFKRKSRKKKTAPDAAAETSDTLQ